MGHLNALILPSDGPPRRSTIKRHLLFFDSVLVVDPADAAVINNYEVEETFQNGMKIAWTARVPFPRTENYDESVRELLRETASLQGQGKIRVLGPGAAKAKVDLGLNWTAYSTAITSEPLVRAAVPDYRPGPPPVRLRSGVYSGFSIAASGEKSKYEVDTKPPATLHNIDNDQWNGLAWARIGRVLKYVRRATAENAYPCATDEPSAGILLALAGSAATGSLSADEAAEFAIAADVVDADDLERALLDASWRDVLTIRREILPHVAKLREILRKNIKIAQKASSTDLGAYRQELAKLRSDFQKEKDGVAAAWAKLKIIGGSSTLTAGGLVAGGVLSTLVIPTTISGLLLGLISGGLLAGGAIAKEFKDYVVARDKMRESPIFFFDQLPQTAATSRAPVPSPWGG